MTIFSNPGHAYMTVAGLRLDTSAADDPTNQQGPRWRPLRQGNGGFTSCATRSASERLRRAAASATLELRWPSSDRSSPRNSN